MKRFCVKSTIVLVLAAALGLIVTTCSADIVQEVEPQAELLSLTVRTADGKIIVVPVIPEPISHTDWNDEEFPVVAADFGAIVAREAGDTTDARLEAVSNAGSRVSWGKARAGNRPISFTDPRVKATFTLDDFLYIKVTADDGITANYYRFYSIMASPVKELANLSISGREAEKVPQAAASMSTLIDSVGADNPSFYARVALTIGEAGNAVINPVPQQENATFRYTVAESWEEPEPPEVAAGDDWDWQAPPKNDGVLEGVEFHDGNILYVEVTAQNEIDKYYYAFMVTAGHIATIATLKLDGVEVVGKGTPMRQWGSVTQGAFASADQSQVSGFRIEIELTDPDAVCTYQVVPSTTTGAPGSGWGTAERVRVPNTQWLALRVRPAVAKSTDTTDMRFYKVQVAELAANFRQQPKSAAYIVTDHPFEVEERVTINKDNPTPVTVDRAIAPLTIELDRTGTFTYQWYTANSWYGGYGFDRDGRIAGDAGVQTDTYHPDPGKYDEKGNISLHNGGNQYYRLPYGGTAITGATTDTYTPVINGNNRPFISGFTNQTQYYYVVVTDSNGFKATSQRAAIVTEWNQAWNDGTLQSDEILDKKHYIVDLYAATDIPKRTEGLQLAPKNPEPFTDGNHRVKYTIPMTLPSNFDIYEYSIVTCQAKFYLADGREWIQNWTQGDFGFEQKSGENVIWYNLTNDNATRALSNSGNEPVSGGLTSNPTALIVQPAGTKPLKAMPPFTTTQDDQGRFLPQNTGDAQGWFTPYIEIVELRFEGPSRPKPND